jgi:peroxiredoxin
LVQDGDVAEHRRKEGTYVQVSPRGEFSLPPQKESFLLLARNDAGFAIVNQRDLPRDLAIRLLPWARVTGTVQFGTQPSANLDLLAWREDPDWPPEKGKPIIQIDSYNFTTDASGRFQLSRVFPGHYDILRLVPSGVARSTSVNMASLDVAVGRSYELKIGGSGRPVAGRLVLPANLPWMVRKATIEPKTASGKPRQYGVQVAVDGRFRAEDIGPGDYRLSISIHEPPPPGNCGWGRLIGEFSREFTIAPIPGGVSDDPLQLGSLEPAPIHAHLLRIGDIAPDFTVRTLEGKDLKLADFQGKVLLLDFWATWCQPCLEEIPNLKAIHDAFAAHTQFAMLSLSLDESPAVLEWHLRSLGSPWSQAFIGPDSPIADAYAATAIPATFLIGPDGKILAKDLRGEKIKTTVAEALKRYRAAD